MTDPTLVAQLVEAAKHAVNAVVNPHERHLLQACAMALQQALSALDSAPPADEAGQWVACTKQRCATCLHWNPYQRDQDFALGRAFVGQQILGILRIPMINFAISETPPERKPKKETP